MPALILLLALLTGLVGDVVQACSAFPQPELPKVNMPLTTAKGDFVLRVELAASGEEKNCGLMGRPRLPDHGGMLFDMRPAGPAHFWMENTPQPLDMVFINRAGQVIYIEYQAEPFSTESRGTSKQVAAVLEIAAGNADKLGIEVGSSLKLPWFR